MFRLALLILLVGCSADVPQKAETTPHPPSLSSSLAEGWNHIATGGETICSDNTDYHFYVRPGDQRKLLVYFQGGGACWSGETCDTDLDPTYKVNLTNVDPATSQGIFDFENPRNPFKDHSVVFIPYCTGDVHIGNRTVTYEASATPEHESHSITTHHRGAVNSQAVLDWVGLNLPVPDSIFVTGSSAGSIPSPLYAVHLADQYQNANITQLGDGSGGYRGQGEVVAQEIWGAMDIVSDWSEYDGKTAKDLTFESLYINAALRHPEITFAAYDTAEDSVQKRYIRLQNLDDHSLLANIDANQSEIRAKVKGFRSYIAGGDLHTILLRPEFYQYHVDGKRVSDWVSELVVGDVADVRCSDCQAPQIIPKKMEDL